MKNCFLNFLVLVSIWSCCPIKTDNNSISVVLNDRNNVSIFDLFESIEIIPLETTDQSIFYFVDGLKCHNDLIFIHDYRGKCIIVFNSIGKFLYKIKDLGQGPEEYLHISDFEIDKNKNEIFILDPISVTLNKYDLKGKFISKNKLPLVEGAYNKIKILDNDIIAFWTYDYKNQLKFYSQSENRIIKECMPHKNNLLDHYSITCFPYLNHLKHTSIDNNIYVIFPDGTYSIDYSWDFGKYNNKVENIIKLYPDRNLISQKEQKDFIDKVKNSEITNYVFCCIGGNQKYRYAQILRQNHLLNIWNKISDNETIVFEKTIEKAMIHPIYWSDDFVVGLGPYAGLLIETIPDEILNEENLIKKKTFREDDNNVLIKYYLKHE